MECWRYWGLLTRHHKKMREEMELEEKRRRDTLLTQSRAIFFGLQHTQDIPPTKQEATRKKPDWGKIERARKQRLDGLETYMTALSCHYEFEKYMGWVPLYEPPPDAPQKTADTVRDEVREREQRMIEHLRSLAAETGNAELN